MDKIAYIIGENFLYWNSIILAVAVVTAIAMFLFLYLRRPENGLGAAILIPLAAASSVVLSRLIHWYCLPDAYESMEAALTTFTGGGYALMGVFAGCALSAGLLGLIRVVKNLPMAFDCMALAGCAGIGVGRLACLYTAADRGPVVETLRALPFAYPVSNAITGAEEWRLATFMIQAIACGVIFLVFGLFYLIGQGLRKRRVKDGDTALLVLAAYGATQIVLDSTRYDSLFLRSNGFISVVQILGAVALVGAVVWFSVRMVKARGFRWWNVVLWVLILAMVGGAGFMEYWVQRHGDQALFSYSVMSACLAGVILLLILIWVLMASGERKKALEKTQTT